MKKIVEYDAKELPSGQSGQAPMPLMPEPVYKPQTPGSQAFKAAGSSLADVADAAFQMQAYNEAIIGTKLYHEFSIEQTNKLLEKKKQYQGDKALPTETQPGFYKIVADDVAADIDDRVNNSGLSGPGKDRLKKTLQESARGILSQAATHQQVQQQTVAKNNIDYDLNTAITAIDTGLIKTKEELEAVKRKHFAMIEVMSPGREDLKLLHGGTLDNRFAKYEQKFTEKTALAAIIKDSTNPDTGDVDYYEAIKRATDPTNPNNAKLTPDQMRGNAATLASTQRAIDGQDEQKMYELLSPVYNKYINGKMTQDDITGISASIKNPKFRAKVEEKLTQMKISQDNRLISQMDKDERKIRAEEIKRSRELNAEAVTFLLENNGEITKEKLLDLASRGLDPNQVHQYMKNMKDPAFNDLAKELNLMRQKNIFSGDKEENIKKYSELMQGLREDAQNLKGQALRDAFKKRVDAAKGESWTDFIKRTFTGLMFEGVSKPAKATETQSDTVTANGTTYKIGDTYNGYKYKGGGQWEKQ